LFNTVIGITFPQDIQESHKSVFKRIRYLKLSSDHKDANYTRKTIICDSSIVMKNNGPQNKGRLITLTNDAADKRVFRLELGYLHHYHIGVITIKVVFRMRTR
jgi:hypothetical protein